MSGDWFADFQERLVLGIPRPDWPELGSPFWELFEGGLETAGIGKELALQAVNILAMSPPPYIDRFLPATIDAAAQVRDRLRVLGPTPDDREAAMSASRDCHECCGSGFTNRFVTFRWRGRPITASCGCICHRCQHGRWIARHYEQNPPKQGKVPLDLARRPELWPEELKFDPPAVPAHTHHQHEEAY